MIRPGLVLLAGVAALPALDLDRELAWWGPLMDGVSPMVAMGAGTALRLDGLRRVERDGSPVDAMAAVAWQETPLAQRNHYFSEESTTRIGARLGTDALAADPGRATAALGLIAVAAPWRAVTAELQVRDQDAPLRFHGSLSLLLAGEWSITVDRDQGTLSGGIPWRSHGAESATAWMLHAGFARTWLREGEDCTAATASAWYAWQAMDPLLIAIGGEAVSATLAETGQERSGPLAQAMLRIGMAW